MDPKYAEIFNWLMALVLSLSIHEAAHALAAKVQGDPTAENEGRLTLNPIAHIDLIGTIILPVTMMLFSGGMFGWAKPVPVDTRNLRNQRWGYMLVALAGPMSNLVLCTLSVTVIALYVKFAGRPAENDLVMAFAQPMMHINAILAVFNLIPVPPLDGGTIFSSFLPQKLREAYQIYVYPYGMFILLALMLSDSLRFITQLSSAYIGVNWYLISSIIT